MPTSRAKKPVKAPRSSRTTAVARPRPRAAGQPPDAPASRLIDQRIRDLGGWRGETLARMRALILEADPAVTEAWKWNNPVWSHDGIICTGEAYQKAVKLTFAQGAKVADPSRLFNSSLEGSTRRAIDIHEGQVVDAGAFKALVTAAVARNGAPAPRVAPARAAPPARKTRPTRLLRGGNPQIAKGDGDAPVQAYLAALPGWKQEVGRRLDALVVRSVPGVKKAVKWNSPFYGREGQGWFLAVHAFTRHVKVTFFRGAALRPVPPAPSEAKEARSVDLREGEALDEAQLASWIRQAAAQPGWSP